MILKAAVIATVMLLFAGAAPASAESDTFKRFEQTFEMHRERIELSYGVPVLERAAELKAGAVAVYVTSAWQCDPRDTQEANARDLFALLRAADTSGRPISVTIIGPDGDSILSVSDASGAPAMRWTEPQVCNLPEGQGGADAS